MYSPLNSYVYIHWILDFKYILLLPDYSIFDLLYVSLYLIIYFYQFKWFSINLLLAACILRYALFLVVFIDICFVFTMYLINLADTY